MIPAFARGPAKNVDVPTATVNRITLRDKVVEQGEIESQSTITGTCEIDDHENKIIFLAPEGSLVKKGDVVCRFDSSKFEEYVSERETRVNDQKAEVETAEQELRVQKDENISSIRAAKQTMEFAELDLQKYIKGDYEVKKSDLEGAISEAETSVEKARRNLENMRTLVKRGFREYEQLREAEQVLKSAELRLTRDKQKLVTLEKFEHVKSLAEFEGKFEEAKHKYEIAQTTADAKLAKANDRLKNETVGLKIQQRRLDELKKNLDRHVLKAPQDGTLVYARDNWRGNGEKLREGKTVYQNQPVFVLPDMDKMQVKVGVHESLVGKIKKGQNALIRVDAFSTDSLRGKVKSVALLSDSQNWQPSNNYSVIVTIDSFPDEMKLKPGMNAEVEILVGEYADVIAVPIQAIATYGRKKLAFVQQPSGEFESREVKIGRSNVSFVEIKSGLDENESVALDAYQRMLAEFGEERPDDQQDDSGEEIAESADDVSNVGETSETPDAPESSASATDGAETSETAPNEDAQAGQEDTATRKDSVDAEKGGETELNETELKQLIRDSESIPVESLAPVK